MTQLSFAGVRVEFGATRLLDDVTFTVTRGERWGIIGRNGAGKTTLFRLVTGELQPAAGSVARASGLSSRAVVELHAATEYLCELVGFMPGFGYLGTNPKELTLPRRAEPRTRVPAGSVALASTFTGIYPFESPGGWQLIGRSLGPALFDVERPEPAHHLRASA